MTGFDVVGFGALNVDKLFKVNRIAAAEEESFIRAHSESCGGSAANTIVGLARLGCKVGFVGKVANDREGALLLEDFRTEHVDTSGVTVVKQDESGKIMGFVDEKGERALYIDSGVNGTIAFDEVKTDYVSQTRFLHLTSFVGEKSFQTQKQLLKNLPETVKISFDPGALYARKGLAQLEPIIRRSHIVMPNSKELDLITGEADYCRGADFLIGLGVRIVAVKLGINGCYVTDGRERHLIEAFKAKTVDTTGAGDAFCAGFLYGLLKEKSLQECGRLGNFVASRCVVKMGARAGLPYAKDLALLI
ncbi:MAG TPA: carbohydrate kinase family protein [Candidatus Bathyarchaeia archaeon]|nr:carbohydrate kinase family protein [Candidatus Bathyarchaeia archaeon]